jgi:hypothetical protein
MNNGEALMHDSPGALTQYQPEAVELSVDEIVRKVEKVREVAARVMKEDIHFGTIPGTQKPTLYKPGAEILGLTFMMSPKYEGERNPIDLASGHREYIIRCDMYHKVTGRFLGSGVGSCSTMESKYRFRQGPVEPTGKQVPSEYWDYRKSDPKKAQELIGGKGFSTKKIDGKWQICRAGEVVENPNISDTYNTVLKIGAKRAYIDATLKATAASEVYTQDQEDILENDEVLHGSGTVEGNDHPAGKPPIQQPQRKSGTQTPTNGNVISEPRRKRLYAISKTAGYTDEQFKAVISACGYSSSTEVLTKHYDTICEFIEGTPVEQVSATLDALAKWCKEN